MKRIILILSLIPAIALGSDSSDIIKNNIELFQEIAKRGPESVILGAEPTFKKYAQTINSVAFSPDGKSIATGSLDDTVRLWDITNPSNITLIKELKGTEYNTKVAFCPNGKYIVIRSADKTARVWDICDLSYKELSGHTDGITSVAFSPDGKSIATGSWDKTARLWNISNLNNITSIELKGHTHWVTGVAFSPDGKYIVTGSWDKTARLWDITNPSNITLIKELKGHTDGINSVAFSSDGKSIATGSADGTARLWDATNPNNITLLKELKGHTDEIYSVAFSPDGQSVATGSNTVKLWNLPDLTSVELKGHEGWVTSAAFSPDSKYIVTGSGDNTARLWNLDVWIFNKLMEEQLSLIAEINKIIESDEQFSESHKNMLNTFEKLPNLKQRLAYFFKIKFLKKFMIEDLVNLVGQYLGNGKLEENNSEIVEVIK